MGTDCFTGEIIEIGSIPLQVSDQLSELLNVNHIKIDKQIIGRNYYSLRGVQVTYTQGLSNGIYLQETLFSDGTREINKVFMGE